MTHIEAGRAAILDLGSEDYYHLADAAVYLPTVPPEERAPVAHAAMRQLLQEGLVELFFGHFATNAMSALPLTEALRVIDDPKAWDPEAFHPNSYCFSNTDAGDAVYRAKATPPSSRNQPNER